VDVDLYADVDVDVYVVADANVVAVVCLYVRRQASRHTTTTATTSAT